VPNCGKTLPPPCSSFPSSESFYPVSLPNLEMRVDFPIHPSSRSMSAAIARCAHIDSSSRLFNPHKFLFLDLGDRIHMVKVVCAFGHGSGPPSRSWSFRTAHSVDLIDSPIPTVKFPYDLVWIAQPPGWIFDSDYGAPIKVPPRSANPTLGGS